MPIRWQKHVPREARRGERRRASGYEAGEWLRAAMDVGVALGLVALEDAGARGEAERAERVDRATRARCRRRQRVDRCRDRVSRVTAEGAVADGAGADGDAAAGA